MKQDAAAPIVEARSSADFATTFARITAKIESAGMAVVASVDHSAAARAAGLAMPPTILILYGNAANGTPLMLAAPRAALDLPLRVLVREAPDGRVLVAFHPAEPLLLAAGVPPELSGRLAPAQQMLIDAVGPATIPV